VTRILAESLTIDDAVPRILEAIGGALGWSCGAFWRVQAPATVMRFAGSWHEAAHPPVAFLTATAGAILTRGVDLPGCVWESGRPEWIPDLIRDSRFLRGAAAAQDGLHTGVAFPVVVGGEVLGVMELFARSAEQPEAEWLQMFAALGGQLGQFLERDEADRALRGSDERMRAVMENMLEGLITTSERNIIEQVNRAAEQMFGYAEGELVGQHLKVLMPRSTGPGADAFLKDAAKRALGRITEWEGRRRNGELFRFELSLFAFQTNEGRHFAGHLRDISERKKLERMKQEFVATVSHELRTPLTSIRGSLSLLTGGALGELPDEARDVVVIAERNTVRLITLINDILDLERLEAGKMELHLEPTPLGPVIDQSVDSVRAFADQQGIELKVVATSARVFGDGDRLVQVLVNLISNAVKFSPRGGSVTTSVVEKDGAAEVRVEDQGRGIPANQLEAIFGRFKQVEAADSRQKGGTGLGLAICKAIVEQHAGTIDRAHDDQDRAWVMRVMAEELRHGYQMLHLLLSKDWSHVSGGVTGPQMVEEILSMTTGNHVLDAFNLDYDSFMDNIAFAAIIDRVGKYQLTMQKVCAYKPMADSMPPMLREEAFHLAAGVIPLRRFAERAAKGDPLANMRLVQESINKWFPRGLEMFGDERGGQKNIQFGFKDLTNREAVTQYIEEVRKMLRDINTRFVRARFPDYAPEKAEAQ